VGYGGVLSADVASATHDATISLHSVVAVWVVARSRSIPLKQSSMTLFMVG